MNDFWTSAFSALLVTLGVLAEINLLRAFLRDWREGQREEQQRKFCNSHKVPTRRPVSPARPWQGIQGKLATVVLAMSAGTGSVFAQESAAKTQVANPSVEPTNEPAPVLASAAKSPFSLQLNLDYTTAYFYHGILQEDTGLVLQPAAKLTVNLYEKDDFKIDALLGAWNSFHGQKTGAQTHGDFTEYWYESDLIAGFTLTKGKVSFTTTYTFLTSPSDAYETVQELDFTLAYDDTDLLGKWALHPYVLLGVETGADGSDGANTQPGTYFELGVAPGFSFDVGKTPVAISFPASVGLSLHDYYQDSAGNDDTFGFAQVGVKASVPLPFGERYGKWTLNAGISAMFLGDTTAQIDNGHHEHLIGTIGIQLNF